jgi:hypothetical protein
MNEFCEYCKTVGSFEAKELHKLNHLLEDLIAELKEIRFTMGHPRK